MLLEKPASEERDTDEPEDGGDESGTEPPDGSEGQQPAPGGPGSSGDAGSSAPPTGEGR